MTMSVAVITTAGRGSFGVGQAFIHTMGQALTSRYVVFSTPGIIGMYVLALRLYRHRERAYGGLVRVVTAVIVVGLVLAHVTSVAAAQRMNTVLTRCERVLLEYDTASEDDLLALFPDPQVVRERAPFLEEHGLNVFRPTGGEG
jgi:hypothetical protein